MRKSSMPKWRQISGWFLVVPWLFLSAPALAQKTTGIGYELIEEIQDAPSKTYTIRIEVWSEDHKADAIEIAPRAEGPGLNVLTPVKTWKNVKRGRRLPFSISAVNAGTETRTLVIDIRRKAGKRTDTKKVSVLVAPQ